MLTLRRSVLVCVVAAALTGLAAVASQRSVAVEPVVAIVSPDRPANMPWWKGSLAHTVQEEWLFAQHMDTQHGPRWRTALPDKTVSRMYQHWLQGRQGGGGP
jgi:hypothetical protein